MGVSTFISDQHFYRLTILLSTLFYSLLCDTVCKFFQNYVLKRFIRRTSLYIRIWQFVLQRFYPKDRTEL